MSGDYDYLPEWCGCGGGEAHLHPGGPSVWQREVARDRWMRALDAKLDAVLARLDVVSPAPEPEERKK